MATNAVIIFDVEPVGESATIIKQMNSLSYSNFWNSNGVRYQLPTNTVWKPNTELQTAVTDLINSSAAINNTRTPLTRIRYIRHLVLNSTPWNATPLPAATQPR